MYIIIFFVNLLVINAFVNIRFSKNKLLLNEIHHEINYTVPYYKQNIIKKINGFYGLIGPESSNNILNDPTKDNNDLFKLFNQNGIIQGIFFSDGKIFFTKKYINTDKFNYEKRNGLIPINHFTLILFETLKKFNFLPNIFGLANTALINFDNKVYALNERDMPYLLDINFKNKTISTNKKIKIPYINNFLAHSKIKNKTIETVDYSSYSRKINYFKIDNNFNILKNIVIKKKYVSMIHDFISLKDHLIFIDSPMVLDNNLLFNTTIPLKFNKNLNSYLFIINKNNGTMQRIIIDNVFLFHFGNSFENEKIIEIYGCFYDKFDFCKPNLNFGKFRKIIINKNDDKVSIEKNSQLEKYSLDFPIIYKNLTILTNSYNLSNKYFVTVKNFKIIKIIDIKQNICGEASIIEISNKPYLICFTNKFNNYFLSILGIEDNYQVSIPIPFNITLGFHSIFLENKN